MPGSGAAQLRGFAAVDVPATDEQLRTHPAPRQAPYDPEHLLLDLRLRVVSSTSGTEPRAWNVSGRVPFPMGVQRRTMPGSIAAVLDNLPPGFDHVLTLEALGGTLGTSCALAPGDITHALDPRGMSVEQREGVALGDGTPPGAVVVMKPPYNLAPELIDRHVEHHAMLGFSRYLLYLQPHDQHAVLSSLSVSKWVASGFVVPVVWDVTPYHARLPAWDQRLIYNHAVLSFKGSADYLFMPDFDEYLVALRPGLENVTDMLAACAPPDGRGAGVSPNLRVARRHVLAADWDRSKAESGLWMGADAAAEHPLSRHLLINHDHPPYVKTMVEANQANQVRMFYIHVASTYDKAAPADVDTECMLLGHLANLYGARIKDDKRISHFKPDAQWVGALRRLAEQRQQWLAGGTGGPAEAYRQRAARRGTAARH
ncbi:hypothetical protein FOA52_001402 [Chlamydomonas sp. UWO 241]|nr:hypothetical protein FOA52_001402 [Chlamydomonas sp. UWO 241]